MLHHNAHGILSWNTPKSPGDLKRLERQANLFLWGTIAAMMAVIVVSLLFALVL